MESSVTVALIAAGGSIFSTIGLNLLSKWVIHSKEKNDVATAIRAELRTEITGLKAEIDELEEQLSLWRGKYWDLKEEYIRKRAELEQQVRDAHSMPTTLLKGDNHGNSNTRT